MSRRLAVALAVVAVAGGVVAIGIAVHADETSPGLPPTAADAPSAPATSQPATTVRPPANDAVGDWPMFGYDAARTNADPRPTAIIYSNDLMAIAGMSAAFARGLRIPEDLSVVGWDDITVSQYLHPALSSVAQHPFDDGRMAATLLLEAIEGKQFDEPVWTPNPRFRPRESSGPAPR